MARRAVPEILALLAACSLAACAAPPPAADGARGVPSLSAAEREIDNGALGVRARGRHDHGRMAGTWTFSDQQHVKVAEITYKDGQPSGPFRFYFDVLPFPRAFGKVRSAGELQGDRVVGRHIVYAETGRVFSDATFRQGHVVSVAAGTRKAAVEAMVTDVRLVRTLDGAIRPAGR